MYMYMYVHIYIYIHIHVCVYIYIYILMYILLSTLTSEVRHLQRRPRETRLLLGAAPVTVVLPRLSGSWKGPGGFLMVSISYRRRYCGSTETKSKPRTETKEVTSGCHARGFILWPGVILDSWVRGAISGSLSGRASRI